MIHRWKKAWKCDFKVQEQNDSGWKINIFRWPYLVILVLPGECAELYCRSDTIMKHNMTSRYSYSQHFQGPADSLIISSSSWYSRVPVVQGLGRPLESLSSGSPGRRWESLHWLNVKIWGCHLRLPRHSSWNALKLGFSTSDSEIQCSLNSSLSFPGWSTGSPMMGSHVYRR